MLPTAVRFAPVALMLRASTYIFDSHRYRSVVPTLAQNARVGHPQSWWYPEEPEVGHPPVFGTARLAGTPSFEI